MIIVDINEHALMERNPRASRKGNSVQFRWPQTSKDCFKYSFIPHTISQWDAIPAGDDMPQFKSQIKSVDLCHKNKNKNKFILEQKKK